MKVGLAALATLFQFQGLLIAGVMILLTIDLITGMYAAYRRGEKITSQAMRRTITKAFTYALFVIAFTVLANMVALQWISEYAFALVAITEAKSIAENTIGLKTANRFIEAIMRKFAGGDMTDVIDTTDDSESSQNNSE